MALATTDTCLELLGALTAPFTRHGAWDSGCQSEARIGSHARYYTFALNSATRVEMNLTSAADTYLFLWRRGKAGPQDAENGSLPQEGDRTGVVAPAWARTISNDEDGWSPIGAMQARPVSPPGKPAIL